MEWKFRSKDAQLTSKHNEDCIKLHGIPWIFHKDRKLLREEINSHVRRQQKKRYHEKANKMLATIRSDKKKQQKIRCRSLRWQKEREREQREFVSNDGRDRRRRGCLENPGRHPHRRSRLLLRRRRHLHDVHHSVHRRRRLHRPRGGRPPYFSGWEIANGRDGRRMPHRAYGCKAVWRSKSKLKTVNQHSEKQSLKNSNFKTVNTQEKLKNQLFVRNMSAFFWIFVLEFYFGNHETVEQSFDSSK